MTLIGIDIGGSTTKIIGLNNDKMMKPLKVKAADPVTSVYGAFGRYITENNIDLDSVSQIKITGVGATHIDSSIYGIDTVHVDEFKSIGLGGLRLSGLDKAIVVSMGTGTAFVYADKDIIYHMGGTGVGGGTLCGLSSRFLDVNNFDSIVELASDGNLNNVDLTIGDISVTDSYMPSKVTAANFGKISDYASKSDIALGFINMVFQTVGMMAVFASRSKNTKDIVLCGNLASIPCADDLFSIIEDLHNVKFHILEYEDYTTALGAAVG